MDAHAQRAREELAAAQSLAAHLLNLPPLQRYETAGGQSTRMIIDSASYTTTPCSSPPPEPSHVFSAYDTHHKVPDVAVLTAAGHMLDRQMHQNELGYYIPNSATQVELPTLQTSGNMEQAPTDPTRHHQGIVPPYISQMVANSEAAGSQALASAEQTSSSSKLAKHIRAAEEEFVPTAPAQRQLEDGRWILVF